MASFVIVTDSSKHQHKIATLPSKQLTDILAEACTKAHCLPQSYALRHGKQLLDLSLTVRLAGLPPGAKLELVTASTRVSAVNLALDVVGAARVTLSVPSNRSLWEILLAFEAQTSLSLTRRASTTDATRRAQPVLSIHNRPFATDAAMQATTLAMLGIQQGSAVVKVVFRDTEENLSEEAIQRANTQQFAVTAPEKAVVEMPAPLEASKEIAPVTALPSSSTGLPTAERNLLVLLPSPEAAPLFSTTKEDEEDEPHTPSIDQASRYLALLQKPNKLAQEPLMTRKQREARTLAHQEARAASITRVRVKCRFPEQVAGGLQCAADFEPVETAAAVYAWIDSLLIQGHGQYHLETGYPDRKRLNRQATESLLQLGFGTRVVLQVVATESLQVKETVLAAAIEARTHLAEQRKQEDEAAASSTATAVVDQSKVSKADTSKSSDGPAKKVPKWLKMGKR